MSARERQFNFRLSDEETQRLQSLCMRRARTLKLKELPGWAGAVKGAREVFNFVPAEVFTLAGEEEAGARTFICGPNEAYAAACRTGRVRLRDGRPHGHPKQVRTGHKKPEGS